MTSISGIADLVEVATLAAVVTYEVGGRRRDGGFEDVEPLPMDGAANEPEFQVLVQQVGGRFAVRLRGTMTADDVVDLVADVAAIYDADVDEVAPAIMSEFVQDVAVMMLFPYVRQHFQDVSSRLGHPVTLQVLKMGDLRVDVISPDVSS